MTEEEKNKQLHEILGIHWHEWERIWDSEYGCYVIHCKTCKGKRYGFHPQGNIDFYTDAGTIQLLRELEKQEWYWEFLACFWAVCKINLGDIYKPLTTPGLLADKLIEWRKVK